MSSTDIDTVIKIVLAAVGKYADKAVALQKDLNGAAQGDDYALLKTIIQQYIQEAGRLETNLKGVLAKVVELESSQTRRELYGERWWQQKQQALYKTCEKDPQDGFSQWLQVYAGALIDWNLGICERLVNESFPLPPQAVDISTLFRNDTKAIVDKKYVQALDMLTYLIQATSKKPSQPILNEFMRATLLVFIGRIYLYHIPDDEVALRYFEQARDLAPKDGRPYAALGEHYRLKKERDKALALYQQAIDLSPKQPDGYIGMGLLLEDQSLWDEADDSYEEAIEAVQEEKDIQAALSKLLAPVSGNVYLQLARKLKKKFPEQALQAVDLAITTGIKHEGAYPERLGYRLKGEILEGLKREQEAAEAYYEAGWRFTVRNEGKIAVELLKLALKLAKEQDSKYLLIHWELADALLVSSYRTKPPYVEEGPILESSAVWETGIAKARSAIEGLDSNLSFICIERARINEQLARLPSFNPKDLYWEGVAYLERAVLSDGDSYSWVNLARYYRLLEQESNALHASRTAFGLDSENPFILEDQISILTNIGDFDAALDMIKKRQELGVDGWVDAVKAYVLIRKNMYQEALGLLQPVLEAASDDIWYHNLRAHCYHLLDDPENARKDYEWIWNCYSETDVGNQDTFGWAAYNLALLASDTDSFDHFLHESIRIFYSRILQKEKLTGVGEIHRYLGLSYLAKNDMKAGKKNLDVGIAEAINARELEDLLSLDFPLFEKSLNDWPHKDQVVEVLDQFKEKIEERKIQLERRRSPEEELKEVIEKHPREGSEINWAWTGAQAGLARLYSEAKQWSNSAGIYLLLQKEGEQFPQAYLGLEKSFDSLQAEGDARMKEGKTSEALEQLLQIARIELLPDDNTRQAQLHSRLGYVYFGLQDAANVRKHFSEAIRLYRESGSPSPGGALSEVCRTLLRNATQYWALDAGLKAIAKEPDTDEILQNELIAAKKSLENYLDEFYKLSEQYVDRNELLPVVTPIALEIGDGLIPEDTSPEWSLPKFYIPEMHQRFQDKMGVNVPDIRVRGSNVLPSNEYRILLDEAEIERDSIYLDMRYYPTSPETLQASDISKATLIEKSHPVTGEPGCWIGRDSWELIINRNLELWAEPLVFIIYHLEAVILRNLSDFIGTQDVENLLIEWRKDQGAAALIASALSDEHAQYHFARILRNLVREQVPITSWKEILETFKEGGLIKAHVSEAVRAIRLRLKEQLPGNNANTQRLELPQEWEDMLISGLAHQNGRTFLTLAPEETYRLLSTIRNALEARDWHIVLVTRSSEIRPFVRRLIENEFPHVMVLSQEELVAGTK